MQQINQRHDCGLNPMLWEPILVDIRNGALKLKKSRRFSNCNCCRSIQITGQQLLDFESLQYCGLFVHFVESLVVLDLHYKKYIMRLVTQQQINVFIYSNCKNNKMHHLSTYKLSCCFHCKQAFCFVTSPANFLFNKLFSKFVVKIREQDI